MRASYVLILALVVTAAAQKTKKTTTKKPTTPKKTTTTKPPKCITVAPSKTCNYFDKDLAKVDKAFKPSREYLFLFN
jgi:hypothetical protein